MFSLLSRITNGQDPHLRACGPIALSRLLCLYRIERTSEQIASVVARRDPEGTLSARTYLMGGCAQRLGLNVAVLQCWEHAAWRVLMRCQSHGLGVIINHAHAVARKEGHYSTMMSIDENKITLDDPFAGPGQVVSRDHFCELWQPNRETSGHTLLALDRPNLAPGPLMPCGPCPDCGRVPDLSLTKIFQPSQWTGDCYRRFFCTHCDGSFTPISVKPAINNAS